MSKELPNFPRTVTQIKTRVECLCKTIEENLPAKEANVSQHAALFKTLRDALVPVLDRTDEEIKANIYLDGIFTSYATTLTTAASVLNITDVIFDNYGRDFDIAQKLIANAQGKKALDPYREEGTFQNFDKYYDINAILSAPSTGARVAVRDLAWVIGFDSDIDQARVDAANLMYPPIVFFDKENGNRATVADGYHRMIKRHRLSWSGEMWCKVIDITPVPTLTCN